MNFCRVQRPYPYFSGHIVRKNNLKIAQNLTKNAGFLIHRELLGKNYSLHATQIFYENTTLLSVMRDLIKSGAEVIRSENRKGNWQPSCIGASGATLRKLDWKDGEILSASEKIASDSTATAKLKALVN